jgi:predicted nucleic acid-binding protein
VTGLERLRRSRSLYFDANIVIYFLDGDQSQQLRAARIWDEALARRIPVFISELGVAECLYGASRRRGGPGGLDRMAAYEAVFADSSYLSVVPLTGAIALAAARNGAALGLKLIDAIHHQSAVSAGCDCLITNDASFRPSPALDVLPFGDFY